MGFLQNSLVVFLCAIAQSSGRCTASKIQWGPCDDIAINATVPIECGDFRVPLDYTKPGSNETLRLQLLRVPAAVQPSLGSIQINFGGPGSGGRESLALLGTILQAMSGGAYDLVAFDPRGTVNTIPFWCYENDVETIIGVLEQQFGNSSDVALGRLWARAGVEGNLCKDRVADTGALLSTAFVARDLIRVAEALDEDGLLRFWGFSYGTTLGATVAAMFPEKIDRMILDGVQNPHQYYHAHADFEEWTDSDKVFSGVFTGCLAAPENCTLAQDHPGKTAEELESAVYDLIYAIKERPLALGHNVLDYNTLKGFIIINLYDSSGWPGLAEILSLLLRSHDDDDEALSEVARALFGTQPLDVGTLRSALAPGAALFGIHCGERTARAGAFEDIAPAIEQLYATSRIMGDITALVTMVCARWPIEARERYEGPLAGISTRNPVLFVGNTYDAHTPLVSARNVSSGFEGSVVLEVNGYGHSSLAAPSICTVKTTAAYFVDGALPEPDTVCEVDVPLYSGGTWFDVLAALSGNGTAAPALAKRDAVELPNLNRIFGNGMF